MSSPVIEARDLKQVYHIPHGWGKPAGQLQAVGGISFSIEAGRTLAVVGESGCGKSTLARMVSLIEKPQQGSLTIAGMDALHPPAGGAAKLRSAVQLVFQNPFASLNPRKTIGTTLELPLKLNTDLSAEQRRAQVADILAQVGLRPEHAQRYPHMFSGGQRQRIAIARALIGDPRILIFDEATSALDYESERVIQDNMRRIVQGRTVLIVAHRLLAVSRADRIITIERGRIIEDGTHDQLIKSGGRYAALHRMQAAVHATG